MKNKKTFDDIGEFRNFPVCDFSKEINRFEMENALKKVESNFSKFFYPLVIGDRKIDNGEYIESINPSKKSEAIGKTSTARKEDIRLAVNEARKSFYNWKKTSVEKRAEYLFDVAEQMKQRFFELSAMIVFEAGKNWREACGDVAESIDFLNFYGRDFVKNRESRLTQKILGEENMMNYIPKGIVGVISPWNFPLAILTGMTSAALIAGNSVIMKPSEETPLIAGELMKMFENSKLPSGVLNYLPGIGEEAGSALVNSPDVNMIAFTGSRKVGLNINQKISQIFYGQKYIRTSVLEMGGKNGIIIDKTADFDSAVPDALDSAFGYQGQKCSACSNLIVLDDIYDEFLSRLVEGAKSLKVGEAKFPGTDVGPIINKESYNKIRNYIQMGKEDGRFLLEGKCEDEKGFYISPTIIEVGRNHVLAKEEIFGPVLSILRAKDFNEAMTIFNSTDYALTGGIYSRTPSNIEKFLRDAEVGNRYVNRKITGAIVERQPFGGFKMSGKGSKAGCSEYLLEFTYQISNSINTERSGHVPGIENFAKYKKFSN